MAGNKPTNLTNFKDVLDAHADFVVSRMNKIAIGTVTAFDSEKQTIQGTIAYPNFISGQWVPFPAIVDAPAVILTGGQAALTMPIAAGDTCLFLFNDRSISSWFQSGQFGPPPVFRMHSMADGIALVGIRNMLNAISDYDMTRALLSWGQTQVGVSATKVRVANAATTLGTQLAATGGLIDQIVAIASEVNALSGGTPLSTVIANLGIIKASLTGLLE